MIRGWMILAATAVALGACEVSVGDNQPQDGKAVGLSPLVTLNDLHLVNTDTGIAATYGEAAEMLDGYDVVFFGEVHRHPGNHLAQAEMFAALYARTPEMTLSLEQFETDTQDVMDRFLAGEIGEWRLKKEGRAWDNYATSYRPLVEFAKARSLPVIAAEAPKNLIVCVGRYGPEALDKMTPEDRQHVAAELNFMEGAYKDKFMKFAGGSSTHGGGDPEAARITAERSFAGQVARDDTMAESIYEHLQANPGRRVLHLDGNFHSQSFLGTVERLQLRDPSLKIAVIDPLMVDDPDAPGFAEEDLSKGTFLLLLRAVPDDFAEGESKMDFIREVMAQREENECPVDEAAMTENSE